MKTAARKQAILDATEALLVEVGGAALTMRKVSDRVGISLGNLQYHFPKRDDLLNALLKRFLKRYEQALQDIELCSEHEIKADLRNLFLKILRSPYINDCDTIFKEVWAASNQSPELQNSLSAYYRRLGEFYRQILLELTSETVAPVNIDRTIRVLLPMLEGHCITKAAQIVENEQLAKDWAESITVTLCLGN